MSERVSRGLILSGGGARAAYQAGALGCIREISREPGGKVPFEILVGTSAGAINLAALAANASSFEAACEIMTRKWDTLSTPKVFEAGILTIAINAARWFLDLAFGGAVERPEPRARGLVDTAPLAQLVGELLPPGAIEGHLRDGVLEAVAISATDYHTRAHTVFVEA
ncbi:MAG: patatin-like phospholipase family protein, partial [Planctomycetes bacterium]|nr:patatin-like phospholipase family protein [Planctomycetota bacterium]